MLRRLFGGSKFLKKMNTLMEIYSKSHDVDFAFRELLGLESLIRTEGERAFYDLNRASLLYDMQRYRESADIIMQIHPLNPEFDARCAYVRTKIMEAMN